MAVNAENIMKRKELYTAPAILEEIELEVTGALLYASKTFEDSSFDVVETEGQVVIDNGIELEHKWE